MNRSPVAGKTFRFTFKDGPMAGKTIEHSFEEDGSLRFRQSDSKGAGTTVKKYESATTGPDVCAVSYLGDSGYTLTVVLDDRSKTLVAFSSNEKMHLMQHGTFEEVRPAQATSRNGGAPHATPRH